MALEDNRAKHYQLPACKGNTWVIGDIHGYAKTFKQLVENGLQISTNDQLILLGDLVDRGPDAKGLIDYIIQLKNNGIDVHCIKGNHDDLMLKSYRESISKESKKFLFIRPNLPITSSWLAMGGDETVHSFGVKRIEDIDPDYADFIEQMPHYIESDEYIFVHAGFNFESNKPFEDVQAMMWIRHYKVDLLKTNGRKVVHGHTPLSFSFIEETIADGVEDFIPLDNGIYQKDRDRGSLLAFNTKTKELVEQQAID